MYLKSYFKQNRRNITKFATGGSFLLSPLLIFCIIIMKSIYFEMQEKKENIMLQIEEERDETASLTLLFTKNQNQQKILDLQQQYITDSNYIESKYIIQEKQIESL